MWVDLSDERMGLSFTVASGPRQHIHSQVHLSKVGHLSKLCLIQRSSAVSAA
jgi:hypothetical protein